MITGKKFLLIDDSNTAIAIMRSMLNASGISNDNIDSTMDSQKAIRLLATHSYDIVVCDYNMRHHIDGALIFDEVKTRKLMQSDGVFICVTGDNSQQVVSHFIELEPDDYLIKPFSAAIFVERIEMVLNRKSAIFALLMAVDNKEYETAIDLCNRYRTTYPEYVGYIDRIHGDCLLRAERHNEAKKFYAEACKNYDHLWPKVGFGQALKGLGELEKAEAVFREILQKHPKQPIVRKHLAGCLIAGDRIPEALDQFNLLHKVNPANPMRELIIANLYAVAQQHDKAAIGYQRFITKVKGTSRFSYGININVPVSLMLASIYTDDNTTHEELVNEARHVIYDQHGHEDSEQEQYKNELSTMVGVAILACLHGEIEDCFKIVSKINIEEKPVDDYYTVLNIARVYGFCGMPEQYEHTMQIARKLCVNADDDILIQSQIKLLEACHVEINQRLKEGGELVDKAFEKRSNNQATAAIEDAYRAFHMVPFHYQLCYLILELTALATPSFMSPTVIKGIISSCDWVIRNDTRPSEAEVKRAAELYKLALVRVEKIPQKKSA